LIHQIHYGRNQVSCTDINEGKISRADFFVDTSTNPIDPGHYIVVVDYAEFAGYPMLNQKITIDVPNEKLVTIIIPQGSADPSLMKSFEPQEVTVVLGVNNTVRWINQDDVGFAILSDNNDGQRFGSPYLFPNNSWYFTFTTPGTFEYHSNPHPWKTGRVIVLEN